MRVGVFDSGIGGLTVLKSLLKKYPNNEYIYYGDTLNLPYGIKTIAELNQLTCHNIDLLLKKQVDIIVIACGTVSSNCLGFLKQKYHIPIYDIITPVIDYINNSDYGNIGVIATCRTIDSHIFKKNISKNVFEIATPELVPLIENNDLEKVPAVINKYLDSYQKKLDILILGCTHYPVISSYLNNYNLLDMGSLLNLDIDNSKQAIDLYFSCLNDKIITNINLILDGYNNINIKEEK